MQAALALAVIAWASIGVACGGGSSSNAVSFPTVISLGGCQVCPSVRNSALAVGRNRVLISLTDANGAPVLDATVHARFYDLNGNKPVFSAASDTTLVTVQNFYINEEQNNQKTITGNDGVYVAHTDFREAGNWGVQIDVSRAGKQLNPIPFTFSVLDKAPEPAIGDQAPPSRQITLANVNGDDSQIDTSSPPRPAMHDIAIADALKLGKPAVIAFATPAFCTSRLCGPIMETVMDPLAKQYAGRATFIHVEPYVLSTLRDTGQQVSVSAFMEWHLRSEPWVFVVDAHGRVVAKFEGIASAAEVGAALQATLTGTPAAAG
jgi:hypothetical protein